MTFITDLFSIEWPDDPKQINKTSNKNANKYKRIDFIT